LCAPDLDFVGLRADMPCSGVSRRAEGQRLALRGSRVITALESARCRITWPTCPPYAALARRADQSLPLARRVLSLHWRECRCRSLGARVAVARLAHRPACARAESLFGSASAQSLGRFWRFSIPFRYGIDPPRIAMTPLRNGGWGNDAQHLLSSSPWFGPRHMHMGGSSVYPIKTTERDEVYHGERFIPWSACWRSGIAWYGVAYAQKLSSSGQRHQCGEMHEQPH